MKAIETEYFGPGNVRGSRIVARDGDNRVSIPYRSDLSSEEAHLEAALTLCRKFGWTGTLVGGHTKKGMVWVWSDPAYLYIVSKQEVA